MRNRTIGNASIWHSPYENILNDSFKYYKKNSFDMVITSPPYNVGVLYEEHDDDMREKDYREFANNTMRTLADYIKPDGRICLEMGSSGRNFPLGWYWQTAAYEAGLHLFSQIMLEHRKSNECAWGSYLKADAVYTIPNFRELFVFYKDSPRKEGGETTIRKDEWTEWTRGRWKINFSIGSTKLHPAQFPVELPRRCMRLFGHKNDLVLDLFMGTGSTGVACLKEDRRFVGIEKTEMYYKIAKNRLLEIYNQPKLL